MNCKLICPQNKKTKISCNVCTSSFVLCFYKPQRKKREPQQACKYCLSPGFSQDAAVWALLSELDNMSSVRKDSQPFFFLFVEKAGFGKVWLEEALTGYKNLIVPPTTTLTDD